MEWMETSCSTFILTETHLRLTHAAGHGGDIVPAYEDMSLILNLRARFAFRLPQRSQIRRH